MPVTTPARTLVDLAASGEVKDLERAVEEARIAGLVTRAQLEALIVPGIGALGGCVASSSRSRH